jgi:hypothetical protein
MLRVFLASFCPLQTVFDLSERRGTPFLMERGGIFTFYPPLPLTPLLIVSSFL